MDMASSSSEAVLGNISAQLPSTAPLTSIALGGSNVIVTVQATTTLSAHSGSTSQTSSSSSTIETSPISESPIQQSILSTSATDNSQSASDTSGIASSSTTATSTTVAATHNSTTNSYSAAVLAGAIIGSALGAVLLALVVTMFFSRRKKDLGFHSSRRNSAPPPAMLRSSRTTSSIEKEAKDMPGRVPWADHLRQGPDDKTLRNQVKIFFDRIDSHVDNFYTKTPGEVDEDLQARLTAIDVGPLARPALELLQQPKTATSMLRRIIAFIVIWNLSPQEQPTNHCLLPPHLVRLPFELQDRKGLSKKCFAAWQAYSEWKIITAFLFSSHTGSELETQETNARRIELVEHICELLKPWRLHDVSNSEVGAHLAGVLAMGSELGLMLMAQTSISEFQWRPTAQDKELHLMVFPALWRLTDDRGVLHDSPIKITQAHITKH